MSNKPTEMLGSRNQANLIVSGGNSSHNSKTEYGFQSLTCSFLHFNTWNLVDNNTNEKIRRTERRRSGHAWTTSRVSDSTRRISYTSKRPIHSTESYSKNSIGTLPSTVYCSSYLLQGLIAFFNTGSRSSNAQ
jgi:hypothetical protein